MITLFRYDAGNVQLRAFSMVHFDSPMNRKHTLRRFQLAKFFRSEWNSDLVEGRTIHPARTGRAQWQVFYTPDTKERAGTLRIGCQVFSAGETVLIRQWALRPWYKIW